MPRPLGAAEFSFKLFFDFLSLLVLLFLLSTRNNTGFLSLLTTKPIAQRLLSYLLLSRVTNQKPVLFHTLPHKIYISFLLPLKLSVVQIGRLYRATL